MCKAILRKKKQDLPPSQHIISKYYIKITIYYIKITETVQQIVCTKSRTEALLTPQAQRSSTFTLMFLAALTGPLNR